MSAGFGQSWVGKNLGQTLAHLREQRLNGRRSVGWNRVADEPNQTVCPDGRVVLDLDKVDATLSDKAGG